ncbi:MAG: leucine-rich repeat domain-containing protein, partial [Bacteroidales bacterium]|nr:leucine-rich repeat domain-containing protein [Bacteroidales bacterium]
MKRLFAIILLSVLSCASAFAYDFSAVCESGQTLFYEITSNEEPYTVKVVVENSGSSNTYSTYPTGDLVIPTSVTYNGIEYTVTCIGWDAFYRCSGLTSVSMGNTITEISGYAFENCSGLTSITIPYSVGKIGFGTFMGCNGLESVYYTGDIAQWCEIIFNNEEANPLYKAHNLYINNTLVTDLVIPESITEIKPYAFLNASCLTSVSLGNSVESIGYRAFCECSGLTEVIISNSVDTIKNYAFENCNGVQSVTIGNSVKYIGDNAFSGCLGLSTVNFNATNCSAMGGDYCAMSNPEYMVFWNCPSLSTVNIGDNVLKIPQNAFLNCESLISVNMGNS